ncbi:MAG: hypothetical protein IMZ52_02395 [Actinobacteria bacterium]|nr:hypothetical protein [Actinomycetota bacterium]MBE3114873.1 hypothetical protein [Actinomycetota bacterium]
MFRKKENHFATEQELFNDLVQCKMKIGVMQVKQDYIINKLEEKKILTKIEANKLRMA